MENIQFGIIIKNVRVKAGLTQEVLGKQIGVCKATISAYEHGIIMPPADTFFEICRLCNVEITFNLREKTYTLKEMSREYWKNLQKLNL